jgi:hypothetical protein
MPSHESDKAAKNRGFACYVVRCFLTDAEIPPVFFAGLRMPSRDESLRYLTNAERVRDNRHHARGEREDTIR